MESLIADIATLRDTDAPIHPHPPRPVRPPLGPEALEFGVWEEWAGHLQLDRFPTRVETWEMEPGSSVKRGLQHRRPHHLEAVGDRVD